MGAPGLQRRWAPSPSPPVTGPGLASQADEREGPGEHPAPGGLSHGDPCWEAARRVLGRDWGGEASQTARVRCALPHPGASPTFRGLLLGAGHTAPTEGPMASSLTSQVFASEAGGRHLFLRLENGSLGSPCFCVATLHCPLYSKHQREDGMFRARSPPTGQP